ncbi:MAG: O-antigen ligase family protein [Ferruginibacter sp.]
MNSVIKIFNYQFYVKEFVVLFFCYLFMDQLFSWIFIPASVFIRSYEKISSFLIYGFVLYSIPKLKAGERIYVGIFTFLMIRLVLESLYKFDTFFQQLTMFYVLFPVIYTIFIKYLCRKYDLDLLEFIAKFYLLSYIVFMVIYGRGFSFNLQGLDMEDLGVFSGDGRLIHATSVFMMIIPLLWYLDQYLFSRKFKYLWPFLFCLVVILIHQHRSVWSCAIFSLFIYLFTTGRVYKKRVTTIWSLITGAVLVIMLAFFFMDTMFPELTEFFANRFGDILDPSKKESTSSFRIEQREVYFDLFLQRPIFGWTFEGFEMPNPLVDWWEPKTGQHFHEGFMEVLFYLGITGFLLKYSFLFYMAWKVFSKKLSRETIIITSFCVSGLVFSLNYVPIIVFWAHVGLGLYYIEKDHLQLGKLVRRKRASYDYTSDIVDLVPERQHV